MVSFGDAVYFLYILKNIFRDSSAVTFCGFERFSRKFLQMSAVPGNAVHGLEGVDRNFRHKKAASFSVAALVSSFQGTQTRTVCIHTQQSLRKAETAAAII